MNIILESTRHLSLEQLSGEKTYVLFNQHLFYIYEKGELKSLAPPPLNPSGTLYVAECGGIDVAMEFFDSKQWMYTKNSHSWM